MSTDSATQALRDWQQASQREWLITNGIGGYASASVAGANTRRYHGLLVAAFEPPLGRAVVFSKLEEEVRIEDHLYLLSSNKYPSITFPQGFRHLESFTTHPVPTFVFSIHEGTVLLQKQIWMEHGANTVYIRYTLLNAPEPIKLALVPFMAYKDYHTEQHRWAGFTGDISSTETSALRFQAYEKANPVFLNLQPGASFAFQPVSGWFFNYQHEREEERGLDFTEDLYCPGRYDGILAPGRSVTFVATVEAAVPQDADLSLAAEIKRKQTLLQDAAAGTESAEPLQALIWAADQFIVEQSARVARGTIIAGYHWFTDWGRDTMISLPGLCLATKRYGAARSILDCFAAAVRNGLLPNRFTDTADGAEFNTVDATLWFFHACHAYAEASGDWAFLTDVLLPHFEAILRAHIDGTLFHIKQDPDDALLFAGEPGVQLTWMDAKVGDWVVTPRIGKPVEIQALWYNAMKVMGETARRAGQDEGEWETQADRIKYSFINKFVIPNGSGLYDVIDGPGQALPDASIPSQSDLCPVAAVCACRA